MKGAAMKVKVARPQINDEDREAVLEALLDDRLMQGPRVEAFEDAFAEYVGVEHAVAVSSGTAALYVTLLAAGIGRGDQVVVPAMGFAAFVEAVLLVGAKPVFCDVDESHCLDPEDLPLRLTPDTRAVIVVHLYGGPADWDRIEDVVAERTPGVPIIEDCAQAHGAELDGIDIKRVGSLGKAGCFSFMATKHITTLEGGMITTNDADLAKQARLIRAHGMTSRHTHGVLGGNFKMSEPQAALGLSQLRRLDEMNEARRRWAKYLTDHIRVKGFEPLPLHRGHVYFWLPYRVDPRELGRSVDEVRGWLADRGVEVRYRYLEPIFHQPFVRHVEDAPQEYRSLRLRTADRESGMVLGLPCRPDMSLDEADHVVEATRTLKRR